MDRPPKMLVPALRFVAVAFAVCLAGGYVIFAQVNAQRQPKADSAFAEASEYEATHFPPGDHSPGAVMVLNGGHVSISAPGLRPPAEYLASSSKSASLAREADSAVIAIELLGGLGLRTPGGGDALAPSLPVNMGPDARVIIGGMAAPNAFLSPLPSTPAPRR
jgi:hypothetical protein